MRILVLLLVGSIAALAVTPQASAICARADPGVSVGSLAHVSWDPIEVYIDDSPGLHLDPDVSVNTGPCGGD